MPRVQKRRRGFLRGKQIITAFFSQAMCKAGSMPSLPRPLVAKFIEIRLPNASREEQIKATEELRELLAVVYRIYLRVEREGKLPSQRDKLASPDTVGKSPSDYP